MAGTGPLLERIRAALRAYDDDALSALANKGLVRRARRDLEKAPPRIVGGEQNTLRLIVEDCTVAIPETIKDASCTCPATGICRHVLAALLYLRETATDAPPPQSCGPEILAVDDNALEKWAGKALFRRAQEAVARNLVVLFEDAVPFVFRLPDFNTACRWMPGAGLSGTVCSCHAREACEHRVAAILAYQVAKGGRRIDVAEAVLGEAAGAPRTREEVLGSVGGILSEIITLGLSRLSISVEQRLRTLAVSAHGVDLPRLERLLRALADEVRLMLARDAQASSTSIVTVAARVDALRCALANPKPGHIGEHRSAYDKVGDISLVGAGARRWRTRSGYVGITVYFWDLSTKNWSTWTESRPVATPGFDPLTRYGEAGPWTGCDSPSLASRRMLRLSGAWRNRQGRLSGRPGTRVVQVQEADPIEAADPITRWSDLVDRAYRLFGEGLGDRKEQDEIVLLRPARWGAARFDEIHQECVRPVFDAEGRPLLLAMPYLEETQSAVQVLEKADADQLRGLLGLVRLNRGRLTVEPVTLYETMRLHNLTLDGAAPVQAAGRTAPAEEEEEDPVEELEISNSTSLLGLLLAALEAQFEAIAEGGIAAYRERDALKALGLRAESCGLSAVARSVTQLVKSLETRSSEATHLLRALYVTRLAADLESVSLAVAELAQASSD